MRSWNSRWTIQTRGSCILLGNFPSINESRQTRFLVVCICHEHTRTHLVTSSPEPTPEAPLPQRTGNSIAPSILYAAFSSQLAYSLRANHYHIRPISRHRTTPPSDQTSKRLAGKLFVHSFAGCFSHLMFGTRPLGVARPKSTRPIQCGYITAARRFSD